MARGNQREKAREKNLKAQSSQAQGLCAQHDGDQSTSTRLPEASEDASPARNWSSHPRGWKTKNAKTGSEMQRDKEALAALMRQKQEAADAKKAGAGGSGKK
ncbi:hypothetical protein CIB48_g10549 [Xylaria polymorpha]|nr:hypothetical protein CIB48_g10549 [Xylaria polymorpha]